MGRLSLSHLVGSGSGTQVTLDGVPVDTLDVNTDVQPSDIGAVATTEKGQPNGVAGLDASALVPPANLAAGARDGTKFLRDDGAWALPAAGGLSPSVTRELIMPYRGAGVLARTCNPTNVSSSQNSTTGVPLFCGAMKVFAGDTLTNMMVASSNTAGSGLTEARLLIVDGNGVVLARTADLLASGILSGGAWATNKDVVAPFVTPYNVAADELVYGVIIVSNAAGVNPNFACTPNAGAGLRTATANTRSAKSWGGPSAQSFAAGSYPAEGATLTFPTSNGAIVYAHLT